MLELYGTPAALAPAARARRAIPRPRCSARRCAPPAAEVVTVSLRREVGRRARRPGLLVADPRTRRARAAQHRRLPLGQGGGDHRAHGARGVRHALDQARGDRRGRHAAAGCLRARRSGAHPRVRRASRYFPYTTEDLVVAERLLEAGCRVLMPWGAPIGSGRGLNNLFGLAALRAHFPEVPLIIDAGLGVPSHAAQALELGLRRGAHQHRGRAGARSGADGGAPSRRRSRPGMPPVWPGRSSRAIWRSPLDAGHRHGVPRMSLPRVYPIVDSAAWVRAPCAPRACAWCSCASRSGPQLGRRRRSARARALCRAAGIQLVVNDYWQLALRLHCDFVHLGQGDLAAARPAGAAPRRRAPRGQHAR